jgi:hypothetical protein
MLAMIDKGEAPEAHPAYSVTVRRRGPKGPPQSSGNVCLPRQDLKVRSPFLPFAIGRHLKPFTNPDVSATAAKRPSINQMLDLSDRSLRRPVYAGDERVLLPS